MKRGISKITIRVYGLMTFEGNILLSRELINDKCYTKFPGGGLEFGEGIHDCLKREFMEETGSPILIREHFYTTENFLRSAFDDHVQVISVYYLVESKNAGSIKVCDYFDDDTVKNESQLLLWKKVSEISTEDLDLPIDKLVINRYLDYSSL